MAADLAVLAALGHPWAQFYNDPPAYGERVLGWEADKRRMVCGEWDGIGGWLIVDGYGYESDEPAMVECSHWMPCFEGPKP